MKKIVIFTVGMAAGLTAANFIGREILRRQMLKAAAEAAAS